MRVILIKDCRGIGRKDDVRNVSDGYARNFLIPHGIARPATSNELEKVDTKKQNLKEENLKTTELLDRLYHQTRSYPIKVPIKVGDKGEVFSSLQEVDVRRALITAEPRLDNLHFELKLDEHIKTMGVHEVTINMGRGMKNTFQIEVVPLLNNQ